MPSEEQLWQCKEDNRHAVNTKPPVITVSHCYIKDNYTNILIHSMEPFNISSRILIDQNADPVLLNFKGQMLRLPFDNEILGTIPRCNHYSRNKKHIVMKDDILYRQKYNDVGGVSHLQVLLPVQLKDTLKNSLHGEVGKQPGISKVMQEIRQNY